MEIPDVLVPEGIEHSHNIAFDDRPSALKKPGCKPVRTEGIVRGKRPYN
jgi:hypothetical protein